MNRSYSQTPLILHIKTHHCLCFILVSLFMGCGRRGPLEPPTVSEPSYYVSRSLSREGSNPISDDPIGFNQRSKHQEIKAPPTSFFLDILLESPSASKAKGF